MREARSRPPWWNRTAHGERMRCTDWTYTAAMLFGMLACALAYAATILSHSSVFQGR